MAGGTIGAHVDEPTLAALRELVATENRPTSQVLAIAIKSVLGLSPGARRALFAIDGIATEQERAFAMKAISRSMLKAYERILDARHQDDVPHALNNAPDDEDHNEAEAVRLCRQ
jgi:hypothetical protein